MRKGCGGFPSGCETALVEVKELVANSFYAAIVALKADMTLTDADIQSAWNEYAAAVTVGNMDVLNGALANYETRFAALEATAETIAAWKDAVAKLQANVDSIPSQKCPFVLLS